MVFSGVNSGVVFFFLGGGYTAPCRFALMHLRSTLAICWMTAVRGSRVDQSGKIVNTSFFQKSPKHLGLSRASNNQQLKEILANTALEINNATVRRTTFDFISCFDTCWMSPCHHVDLHRMWPVIICCRLSSIHRTLFSSA